MRSPRGQLSLCLRQPRSGAHFNNNLQATTIYSSPLNALSRIEGNKASNSCRIVLVSVSFHLLYFEGDQDMQQYAVILQVKELVSEQNEVFQD